MQSLRDTSVPRKRITTYGKPSRKHVVSRVDLGRFDAHAGDKEDDQQILIPREDTLEDPHQTVPTDSSGLRSVSIPSVNVDMFEVPSSDDEESFTPVKKRKTAYTARDLGEMGAISQPKKDGIQHLQSLQRNLLPSLPQIIPDAKLPKTKLSRQEKWPISAKAFAKTINNSNHTKFDSGPTLQQEKTSHAEDVISSPSAKSLPTRPLDMLGKRNRHSRTSSPDLCGAAAEHSSRVEARAAPGLSGSSRQTSPVVLVQTLSTPSTLSVHEYAGRDNTRSVTPTVLTPKGQRMWDGLLGDEPEDRLEHMEHIHGSSKKYLSEDSANPKKLMPRRRLIDSLINQFQKPRLDLDSYPDSEMETDDITEARVKSVLGDTNSEKNTTMNSPAAKSTTGKKENIIAPVIITIGNQISQNAGPKITYSRHRSMLAEQEMTEKAAFDTPLDGGLAREKRYNRRGSIPVLPLLHSQQKTDEMDEGQSSNAIRTIHELRQAGAQNRFLDEVEDLLDRVGTPAQQISIRRSGLMDLADKMKDKDFQARFVSNGLDQRLFIHLGQEEDVICGFTMISLLMVVLDSGTTLVPISQLRRQGITRLFIRLLDFSQSIIIFAKARKINMTKSALVMLSQQHEMLLKLGIWGEWQPDFVSPRTAALRCLETIIRQSREAGNTADLISKELTTKLFGILKLYVGESSPLGGLTAVDFKLALSTLESHSLKATTILNEHLPIVRDILQRVLQSPADEPDVLQHLTLGLTLNVTNNDSTTSEIFATRDVMRIVGCAIISRFTLLSKFLIEEERLQLVDHVILLLGVMMNFAQWSTSARQAFSASPENTPDSLDGMIDIFSDNLENISEADSVEDSQRNVAFGYLAVLLGYFALEPEFEKRFRMRLKSLQPLISSIEEFMSFHEKVDELYKDETDDYNPQTSLTKRIRLMVDRLKGPVR